MNVSDFRSKNAGEIALTQIMAILFISALAIIASSRVALLHYKKKLEFNTALDYDSDGNYTMELYIANARRI